MESKSLQKIKFISVVLLLCLLGCTTPSIEPRQPSHTACNEAVGNYHNKYQSFLSEHSQKCKSNNDCFLWYHKTDACDLGEAFSKLQIQTDSFKELNQLRTKMGNSCGNLINHICEGEMFTKAVCRANICEAAR